MLGFYNYTVILTYLGMLISFMGISFAMSDNIYLALFCLMLSGLCDMFDGKVASTLVRTNREKRFGIQIDSLSDLISFGVFPAIIIYKACGESRISLYIGGIYLLCALIRLAYFNVDEEERQSQTQEARSVYVGLPVTTAALIVPLVFGLVQLAGGHINKIWPIMLLTMAVLFLAPFELKKPDNRGKIGMLLFGVAELVILLMGMRL